MLNFSWPNLPFQIALVEPQIPLNTGNIARLCAATGTLLHLIDPLGFRLHDPAVKRAGLDYWDSVKLFRHADIECFFRSLINSTFYLFSTRGKRSYTDVVYQPGDVLIFGSETQGLPQKLLEDCSSQVLTVPMQTGHVRSLNLANTVSIVLYEALRQQQTSHG
ncbi:MAG: tRNA (uridine(34)/cytosine(34)/5-carboxymethylaminomethyluridine(34)-2'-O)-methyltransferase TrmL [Kiritimatiellae bacterium]|nr:tRNA (uridine(34)/cytosine(34)/5-carboxymethylaminomethyluridine(34)-2'-O)-methyltransferase TrmL [Kiritimatiellia bacterium]